MIITIAGHPYTLIESDPGMWSGDAMGRSSINTGVIQIRETMPKVTQCSTILHEIIHQVIDLYDLPIKEEMGVSVLAMAVLDLIRNNPLLISRIQSL